MEGRIAAFVEKEVCFVGSVILRLIYEDNLCSFSRIGVN